MKKILGMLAIVGLGISAVVMAEQTLIQSTINGHGVDVIKVVLDANTKIVTNAIPNGQTPVSLQALMDERGGVSAINGGFFCPDEAAYSRCEANTTQMVRIVDDIMYSKWGEDIGDDKAFFGFTDDGAKQVLNTTRTWEDGYGDKFNYPNSWRNTELDEIHDGMSMPVLLDKGVNLAVYNTEMNMDPKQGAKGTKGFICSTIDPQVVYLGYVENVSFSELADYIKGAFACQNAIQLDSGGTRAMVYKGDYIAGPGRNMMDAFVILETESPRVSADENVNPLAQALFDKVEQKYASYSLAQRKMIYQNLSNVLPSIAKKFDTGSQVIVMDLKYLIDDSLARAVLR